MVSAREIADELLRQSERDKAVVNLENSNIVKLSISIDQKAYDDCRGMTRINAIWNIFNVISNMKGCSSAANTGSLIDQSRLSIPKGKKSPEN